MKQQDRGDIVPPISQEQLLRGFHEEERIIGAFLSPLDDSRIDLYLRRETSTVTRESHPFYPFFHLSDASLIEGFAAKHWIRPLHGEAHYRYLCVFTRWRDMWDAIQFMSTQHATRHGSRIDNSSHGPILLRNDPSAQFLLQSGRTSFKGMEFSELHRMQIAPLYVTSHAVFNPEREADRIVMIGLSDNRGWNLLIASDDERQVLTQCVDAIRTRDPDVIEGHQLFSTDIPALMTRCEKHGIEFSVGRENTRPETWPPRSAESEQEADGFRLHGRHLIDTTFFLWGEEREIHDPGTQTVWYLLARLDYEGPRSQSITPQSVNRYWRQDRRFLAEQLRNRLLEIDFICSSQSLSAFYLSQCVPLNYGSLFSGGSSTKIELLMLREYIRKRASIPRPETVSPTAGGYSAVYRTGLYRNVLHVDVESMYPSIMIIGSLEPRQDTLHVFLPLLEKLTQLRLQAKRAAEIETAATRRKELNIYQYAMKILINSFYGYLGYPFGLFNDSSVSQAVVMEGQRILRALIATIVESGGAPLEVDTDGIYFVPPSYIDNEEKETTLLERLATTLPAGMHLAIGGRFRKMLSYKIKNYALLDHSDRITIKGSSLTARNMEKFARDYVEASIECLLREDVPSLRKLYQNLILDFRQHRLTVRDFARTETLRESTEEYQEEMKKQEGSRRGHSAVHEALLRAKRYAKAGERISYYFAGTEQNLKPHEMSKLAEEWISTAPDENLTYYSRRVSELATRFEPFFSPADFHSIFSWSEDLFAPDVDTIRIQNRPVEQPEK